MIQKCVLGDRISVIGHFLGTWRGEGKPFNSTADLRVIGRSVDWLSISEEPSTRSPLGRSSHPMMVRARLKALLSLSVILASLSVPRAPVEGAHKTAADYLTDVEADDLDQLNCLDQVDKAGRDAACRRVFARREPPAASTYANLPWLMLLAIVVLAAALIAIVWFWLPLIVAWRQRKLEDLRRRP